jgi:hypothetical protein
MLSSSAIAYDYDLNLASIGNPSLPTGVPGGTELLRFVDAIIANDPGGVAVTQTEIVDVLGPESLVDAASVFGNFEMMNRVAEGTGIAVPPQAIERMKDTIDELGMVSLLKS